MTRDEIQRLIDYTAAYGGGPRKFERFPSVDLVEAADRWRSLVGGLVHLSLSTIERTIQKRIDEEGCGAVFAALKYPQVDANCVAHRHTLSADTSGSRHGDMSGDAVGDAVTFKTTRNQRVRVDAPDLGSSAAAVRHLPTYGNIPLETQVKHLKEWYNFPPPL